MTIIVYMEAEVWREGPLLTQIPVFYFISFVQIIFFTELLLLLCRIGVSIISCLPLVNSVYISNRVVIMAVKRNICKSL